MLVVSPLRNPKNERESEMESFSMDAAEFPDFSGGNLLDSIDFDDIFIGISDGDCLPDLVMDPELLADFSLTDSDPKIQSSLKSEDEDTSPIIQHQQQQGSGSGSDIELSHGTMEQERSATAVSKRDDEVTTVANVNNDQSPTKSDKAGKKSTANSKNPPGPGKRKVKVDWTPELHRRFVQAVEQLGVDKAVPSRILELMGIDCLTRHNIASHLQKYRSHRKHLLAREAEAASWGQRRQATYGSAGGGAGKRDHISPWIAPPTLGFPPPVTPIPHFRPPLHVWGHPSVDQSMIHMWPKHQTPPPPQAWPAPQPADFSFWIPHHQVATPGTPCFPPHLTPTTFPAPPVAGISPPGLIKAEPGIGFPPVTPGQALPRPPSDVHPSKETVDAAIGDVLSKPWLPLPLGLKPPSVDSVMVELQRQGISKVPPTCG